MQPWQDTPQIPPAQPWQDTPQQPWRETLQRPPARPWQDTTQRPAAEPWQGMLQIPPARPWQDTPQQPWQDKTQIPPARPWQDTAQRPPAEPWQDMLQRPATEPWQDTPRQPWQDTPQIPPARPWQDTRQQPWQDTAQRPPAEPWQDTRQQPWQDTAQRPPAQLWQDIPVRPRWSSSPPGGPATAEGDLLGTERLVPLEPMEAYHAEIRRRRRRTRTVITACVVAVVLLGTMAIFVSRHQGSTAGRSPSSPSPSPSPAAAKRTSTATTSPNGNGSLADPSKITLADVFPGTRLVADGMTFTLVTSQVDNNCSLAARGAFAAALTSARCERVVRATFVSSTRQYAVTAGVAALPSVAAAQQVDNVKKFGPDVWFTGLNGVVGSGASLITKSGGYGYDVVDGQYILFAFATFSDGRKSTSHGANLPQLVSLSSAFTLLAQQSITRHVQP